MYYKYFNEITLTQKIKDYVAAFIRCVLYAIVLTGLIGYAIGFRPVYIIGESMTPTIKKYDIVLIKPISQDDIKIGDVITYIDGGGKTTHRVFDIRNGKFYTIDEPTYIRRKAEGRDLDYRYDGAEVLYSSVQGRVCNRLVIVGDIVQYLTGSSTSAKLSWTNVMSVLFTLCAIWQLLILFKRQDKYEEN